MKTPEQKAKILVVEDEADIQQVLCVFIEYSGFEVLGVSNGQEAIKVIPEFQPQLIVLDLMMQPVSGWEVLRWLRANRLTPPLPVLVLTALTQLRDQIQGFEEGAIEYLTKPTQPHIILDYIKRILALSEDDQLKSRSTEMNTRREILERLSAPQPDEFVY